MFPQLKLEVYAKEKPKVFQPIVTHKPLEQIQMDYIDLKKYSFVNLGYSYCLVLIDVFSKYLWVFPCKSREAVECGRCLRYLFDVLKIIPKALHSDQGNISRFQHYALHDL
jgi:hypothetical protein